MTSRARVALLAAALALLAGAPAGAAQESVTVSPLSQAKSKAERRRRASPPTIGMYDPALAFRNESGIGLEHYFVFWQALDLADLRNKILYAETRRRRVMITVEPYTTAVNWTDGGDVLLMRVARGEYDQHLVAVCTEIAAISGAPLVRWGHEMDDRSGRYPWAGRAPADYVAAFRYFVRRCREIAPRAEFVWSPMGRADLADYYPGDDVVDHVGLPIWGYQKADRRWFGRERAFYEALAEKYALVERFKKEVIVAEFGVSGSGRYERAWLESFVEDLRAFPLVTTVAYFNDREPYKWPDGLGSPDWRVKPAVIGLD